MTKYYQDKINACKAEIQADEETISIYQEDIKNNKQKIDKLQKESDEFDKKVKETGKGEATFQFRKGFAGLTDEQINEANSWIEQHEKTCHSKLYYKEDLNQPYPNYKISWYVTHIDDMPYVICETCEHFKIRSRADVETSKYLG